MYFRKSALILGLTLLLSACGHDYPLVANAYPKTATLTALDTHGHGNFSHPVAPGGCMLAFKSMPELPTLQVEVYIAGEVNKTYDSATLAKVLGREDFSKGVFVVGEQGIAFVRDYDCASETR